MKRISKLPPSTLIALLLVVSGAGLLGVHTLQSSSAATNSLPTGSFSALSCSWDATKNDYKYTIPGKWSDPDASATNPANGYLGNKDSVGTYGGAGSSTASDAIDNISHNGPSYTWTVYRSVLPDTKWPVKLWAHDIGNTTTPWRLVDTASKPGCPAHPTVSLSASPGSVTSGSASTLLWSSTSATSCTASGAWSGGKTLSGSASTGALSATGTYSLTCSGAAGSAKASATITVTAAPTPTPTPTPTGGTKPGSGGGSTPKSGTKPTAPPVYSTAPPTANADGKVTVGTLTADVTMPAGNAAKVSITFNPDSSPGVTTPDQTVTGSEVTVHIDNLSPRTIYTYTIKRTNSIGASATSTNATFTTTGYEIALQFNDGKGKAVSGISGSINDSQNTKSTSGKDGKMTFSNLPDGVYTITYTYKNHQYTADFDTSTNTDSNSDTRAHTVVLSDVINVDAFTANGSASKGTKKSSGASSWIVIILIVLAFVAAFILVRRRMARRASLPYTPAATPAPDVIDQAPIKLPKKQQPPQPTPEHMGESLRDMVVKSMHEEALKRKQQGPPENPPDEPPDMPIG